MGISSILLIAAFILTFIAAFWRGGPWPERGFPFPHPGWLGVSLWFLSLILGGR